MKSDSIRHPDSKSISHCGKRLGLRRLYWEYLQTDFSESSHCGILLIDSSRMHDSFGHSKDARTVTVREMSLEEIQG